MKKLLLIIVLCFTCNTSSQNRSAIDWRMVELEWKFIKQSTGAPDDLVMSPIIVSSDMPVGARMMFQYPTEGNSNDRILILINPATLETYDTNMVSWGIGHELTHYAMLLQENSWDLHREYYTQTIRHHCNPKFMRITKEIADLITSVYHDEQSKYQMYHQVQRSCVNQPNQ